MAYYDRTEALRKQASKEKYEELKKMLITPDENKLNNFFPAYEHLRDMELIIEKQNAELKKYKEFFVMLNNLLPEKFGPNTIIG